jgi:hypothetical protein
MGFTKEAANERVTDYLHHITAFLNNECEKRSDDLQVTHVFFLIGKFNLLEHLETCLNHTKLIDYYKYVNLFYYTILAGIFYNQQDVLDLIMEKQPGIEMDEYKKSIAMLMKHRDREFLELLSL